MSSFSLILGVYCCVNAFNTLNDIDLRHYADLPHMSTPGEQ